MTPSEPLDEQAYGAFCPTTLQRLLIELSRHSILRRGFFRRLTTPLLMALRPGPIDHDLAGAPFRFDVRDNTTDSSALLNPQYDAAELAFLAEDLRPGGVFVDIGANVGFYTAALARRVGENGRVIAIEPNPLALKRLRFNVTLLKAPQISIVPTAVGARQGVARFRTDANLGYGHFDADGNIEVPVIPLLSVIDEQHVGRIDAAKIDVEGYEDDVLVPFFDAAPRSFWPRRIVIEHQWRAHWRVDCVAHLLAIGYVVADERKSNIMLRLPEESP